MRVNKIVSLSVVILLITVVFAGAVPAAAAQYDTMQFRYNAQHTGDYSPVAGPVPSNGQLKWSYATNGLVESSPAVVNGVVYVGCAGEDHNVYAINATTGAKLWNYTTGGDSYSSPAVVNGVVYVGSGNDLYALNANNGAKLWNYTTTLGYVIAAPAVANGVVYVGSENHNLYALNATTGKLRWNYTAGWMIDASPAIANGVVYVGSGETLTEGALYALNATTGTLRWSYAPHKAILSSPAVVNGVVYVGCDDHNVYAINAQTGTKLWNYTTGDLLHSSPAVVNGVVYVGSFDNNLYALNARTGAKLWNYTTGGSVWSSPAVVNGVVYVGSQGDDHNVYAINATTGAKLWNYTTENFVISSPAVVNGVVYVGSDDGKLYAIGNETALTISAPSLAVVNKPFAVNGTLTTTDVTPIASATIQLQKNVSGTWQNVTGKTDTTTSSGRYSISTSEPAAGTYQYRTTYGGSATSAGANSTSVSVRVVSKASVQQDLATLRTTINQLPNSVFIPGTKSALLSLLSATELQVKFNLYGSAATTLQKAVLPRMDGCAKIGRPDSDDWVRTCSAQGQLYPQVQNLIQELQALGS